MVRTVHYQIKHLMANMNYESLLQLISDCGSDLLRKFMKTAPENANYTSSRTFQVIKKGLNDFTEEPLLESIKLCTSCSFTRKSSKSIF